MSIRSRLENFIDATREQISTMSGRYRISPLDFDRLYQLYQEDTSKKGLYEFIVGHSITHNIASRLGSRPIDVLAAMVGKTADACQQELDAEIALRQAAEKKAAEEQEIATVNGEKQKANNT
ncbi:guanylate kinase [Hypoxylon texense]